MNPRSRVENLIKVGQAWLDGRIIQYKGGTINWTDFTGVDPTFSNLLEWRVKPEKKQITRYIAVFPNGSASAVTTSTHHLADIYPDAKIVTLTGEYEDG